VDHFKQIPSNQLIHNRLLHLLPRLVVVPKQVHRFEPFQKRPARIDPGKVLRAAGYAHTIWQTRFIPAHGIQLAFKNTQRIFRIAKLHTVQNRLCVLIPPAFALAGLYVSGRAVLGKYMPHGFIVKRKHKISFAVLAHTVRFRRLLRNSSSFQVI